MRPSGRDPQSRRLPGRRHGRRRLICLVGLPGSGKSTVASMLHNDHGLPVVIMGDAVRREAELRGMRPSPGNMRVLTLKLREERGEAAVAELCIPPIKGAGSNTIVIDGVRSLAEVRRFQEFSEIALLGVFSPRWLRFKRLRKRRRSDAPRALKDLYLRDMTEIDVGLGNVFALADYVLINDRGMEDLRSSVRRTFTMIR